ncbi:MAG: SRPBCC family protein [Bryobacteraceae bacterium]
MKIYTLRCEMKIPASQQDAFAVFENPHNLAKITPPWLNFRITSREPVAMRKGAEIEYRIRWLGVPIRWTTVIAEYEPPRMFVDQQAKGPYTLWRHRHTFEPVDGGTLVSDTVEYALPFGWLGRLMHRLLVARQLREIFRFRQRALLDLYAAPGPSL